MLRKTLQDEIQAKTSLHNKMESETDDFDKYQTDSSRKLARVSLKEGEELSDRVYVTIWVTL